MITLYDVPGLLMTFIGFAGIFYFGVRDLLSQILDFIKNTDETKLFLVIVFILLIVIFCGGSVGLIIELIIKGES
jgi:hypothetical protein